MAIPGFIHQTYKTRRLPLLAPFFINSMRRRNPGWQYCFYTDDDIAEYILKHFGTDVAGLYGKIRIGAAKADFFRYCVMYQTGGIYMDIDSTMPAPAATFLLPEDTAVISHERNPGLFVQWALVYAPGHPFMQETIKQVCHNIKHNLHPNNVHALTGPGAYTQALNQVLKTQPETPYRVLGTDYNGNFKFKYPLYSLTLKLAGTTHWRKQQQTLGVLNNT